MFGTKGSGALLTGDARMLAPLFVALDVTRRCNLQCAGCPYHSSHTKDLPAHDRNTADMPLSFVKRLCAELRKTRTRSIVVEGSGEPFVHPEIHDMISDHAGDNNGHCANHI